MADSQSTDPLVSLVIPCLNEEAAIGRVARKAIAGFHRLAIAGEVVVVDNGSTDASVIEARRAGARVVFEPRRGYGSALRRGFAEARGRYIFMADGDDTYPVDDLVRSSACWKPAAIWSTATGSQVEWRRVR